MRAWKCPTLKESTLLDIVTGSVSEKQNRQAKKFYPLFPTDSRRLRSGDEIINIRPDVFSWLCLSTFGFLYLACPSSWTTNGQYCFYINVARFRDRARAQQICSSLGANLPIIRNSGERDFIFNLLKNKAGLSNEGVWLGLNRHGSSFRWYDGTYAGYQVWGNREPNNHGGNENCAQMYKGGPNAGKWNDNPCSGYGAAPSALCQKKVSWHSYTWWRDSHTLVRKSWRGTLIGIRLNLAM